MVEIGTSPLAQEMAVAIEGKWWGRESGVLIILALPGRRNLGGIVAVPMCPSRRVQISSLPFQPLFIQINVVIATDLQVQYDCECRNP